VNTGAKGHEEQRGNRGASQGCDINDLTEREFEVFLLMVRGLTNTQIADELCISENTVRKHSGAVLRKTHAPNRTTLAYRWLSGE
jgi:DNA-binding NarL/FixJ family response regulator